jgi:hypothetical protein
MNSFPARLARFLRRASLAGAMLTPLVSTSASAEVILQYFETPWTEVEARLPEIAAAGYDALWLPPPTKGTEGARDVGYAIYDRFDLGDRDQRGTIATRYGTKDELLSMVQTAHRFGVRVYFDVLMNHNGNPNTVENSGVTLDMVELDGWPGMSPFDFHLLPARQQGDCAGQTGCAFCAFQPGADNAPEWKVVRNVNGTVGLNSGGGDVCIRAGGSERRVASLTMAQVENSIGSSSYTSDAVFQFYKNAGFTHWVRSPDVRDFGDFSFELMNWALLGLQDICTEQYLGDDALFDGRSSITGVPLPRFVRHPANPEFYPDGVPVNEDVREMLMRWIRWLMLETGADGFRLDAIKHVFPNFYASDFADDTIAFNKVIQDTYDEIHGFTDTDDADLVDDAAIFGENFTGDFGALRPYVETGMRALDFPLFFRLAGFQGSSSMYGRGGTRDGTGTDIGQLSVRPQDIGGYGGLNRLAGVGFAHSHDKCQGHEQTDENNQSSTFSRCTAVGGQPDLIYSFVVLRDADSAVFFDGNRWTNQSFVRSGRPDALPETFGGRRQEVISRIVTGARRVARGSQENRFVAADSYAFERVVPGQGPAGLVVLHDRVGIESTFGAGSSNNAFIVTTFPVGTELVELTGNALPFGRRVVVLDPGTLPPNEQEAVNNGRSNYEAANNAPPPPGHGVFYTGVPGGPSSNYVIYAPEAARAASNDDLAAPVVLERTGLSTVGLAPGLHAVHVRFRRAVVGAADAQDEVIVPVCVASNVSACGTVEGDADPLPGDPVESGLIALTVGGIAAPVHTLQTAPPRQLPDGSPVAAAVVRVLHIVPGGTFTVRVTLSGDVPTTDVGLRIDDDPALVAAPRFSGTPERFLDGFGRMGDGDEPTGEGEGEGEGEGQEGEGEGEGEGEEGEGEGEGEGEEPEGDEDGDGVRNGDDVCVAVADPEQGDFDDDGRGDACDLCPDVAGADPDGCPALTVEQRARVTRIAVAIATGAAASADVDENGDGVVDVVDLDLAIGAAIAAIAAED